MMSSVIEHQMDIRAAERDVVRTALDLIDNDQPNRAARLLRREILEGRTAQAETKEKMDAAHA